VNIVAALSAGPAIPTSRASLLQLFNLFQDQPDVSDLGNPYDKVIVVKTSIAYLVATAIPLNQITKVKLFIIRSSVPITIKVTSAVGSDQAMKVADFRWQSDEDGDEITAIKILGTADVEFIVAGE